MAQTSTVKQLLKRLEDGTGAIRARYESLVKASDAGYQVKIAQVDQDYTAAANAASAEAKINLKNNLEKMADAGYLRSGETVQATIAANSDRAKALSALAVQRARDKKEYESEMANARATLSLEGEKEAMDYENELSEMILAQENADRAYEAEEKQRAIDNQIKKQSLAQEKAIELAKLEQERMTQAAKLQLEAAQAAASAAEKESKSSGIEPEKSPYEYVEDIVERNTKYNQKKGYKVIDRKAILLAISSVVKDTRLSYRYRYEMYLYGKSLGYVE